MNFRFSMVCAALTLSACGGGGSSSPSTISTPAPVAPPPVTPVVTYPSSGTYAFTLKVGGSLSSPTIGASLIHPTEPNSEYVITQPDSGFGNVKTLYSGKADSSLQAFSGIAPVALLYILYGDVKRIPLIANGQAPLSRVTSTGTSTVCDFVVDANDYEAPNASRFIVRTKGIDTVCGTSDDGQAELTFDTTGTPKLQARATNLPKISGVFRDKTSLVPKAWVADSGISSWSTGEIAAPLRINPVAGSTTTVSQSLNTAIVEYAGRLSVWTESGGVATETKLDSLLTAGTGWQEIGYDADNFYVQRSSKTASNAASSTYTVLKIARATKQASILSSGGGYLYNAAMGTKNLYLTTTGGTGYILSRHSKMGDGDGIGKPLEFSASKLPMVLTSNQNTHLLWRISSLGTTSQSYTIEMLDETTDAKVATIGGGFPQGVVNASTALMNVSENRSKFLFLSGYSAASSASEASLQSFDAGTRKQLVLGTLPKASELGAVALLGQVGFDVLPFQAGALAAVTPSQAITSLGGRTFSFDVATPNSLKFTTGIK